MTVKRTRYIVGMGLLLTAWGCVGCDEETAARKILEHNTSSGKLGLAMLGKPEDLIRKGRIDAHRRVTMADGVVIDAWVILHKGTKVSRGTVVVLHGWLNSKVQNLGVGEELARRGFDVILPDHRCHGASTGRYVTWGAKESRDVKALVDAMLEEKLLCRPVYVWGVSMGGATSILYGALDERCRGVFAVAPYRDGREITHSIAPFSNDADFQAAWKRAGQIGGFDPADTDVIAAAQKLKCPLIIAHGMLDTLVPYENGKSLYDAAPQPKKLLSLPAASHSTILLLGPKWFAEKFELLVNMGEE
jgi:pimeloyl-ACP methyl ester carboxylesterase